MVGKICIVLISMELLVMIFTTIWYIQLIRQIHSQSYSKQTRHRASYIFSAFCMVLFAVTYALSLVYAIRYTIDGVYLFVTVVCGFGAAYSVSMVSSQRNIFLSLGEKTADIMRVLVNTAELKDPRTYGHSQHVRNIVELFYNHMPAGLKNRLRLPMLLDAAYLHDIGKIGISNEILNKQSQLTDEDWALLKSHPRMGVNILRHSCFEQISDWILYHHERPDGTGYYGLKGSEIPLESRIIAIADSYSAMTSRRSYNEPMSHEQALAAMRQQSGKQFDAALLDVFASIPKSELVRLDPV